MRVKVYSVLVFSSFLRYGLVITRTHCAVNGPFIQLIWVHAKYSKCLRSERIFVLKCKVHLNEMISSVRTMLAQTKQHQQEQSQLSFEQRSMNLKDKFVSLCSSGEMKSNFGSGIMLTVAVVLCFCAQTVLSCRGGSILSK